MAEAATKQGKYMYLFGDGKAEGGRELKHLLGGKGANLAEMCRIGLPVPPAFTLTTEVCRYFTEHDGAWPDGMSDDVEHGVRHIEEAMGLHLGDPADPLLLSVRSGAAKSMPGMMDTVLNLGLNDEVVDGLARKTGNERFAFDAYRRFIDMFGDVVKGMDRQLFSDAIDRIKKERGVENDIDLDASDLEKLVESYKSIYEKQVAEALPQDPEEQLRQAIDAVFGSWNNERAITYRRINGITGLIGTAVNVQAMVYGNMGKDSGTGVCFTRNPATGEDTLYGEFLPNAQGEDVVAGLRTPRDIQELQDVMPDIYDQLQETRETLEQHYQNMEDLEFTVQEGQLFLLQTRDGKRTGTAAIKVATDMVRENLVDEKTAVRDLVKPNHLKQLLHPRFEDEEAYRDQVIGRGLPASPGAAVGQIVFNAEDALDAHEDGQDVILVRVETSPEDVGGMDAAEGILTSRGGMTSHAAVVARGWGKPCVAGCSDVQIDYDRQEFTVGGQTFEVGDWISINGTSGEVIDGQQPLIEPEMTGDFKTFMKWVEQFREMGVRANADTPDDARQALEYGAEGIGLCRTEHMFFAGDRIRHMRRMILADTAERRDEALSDLLPHQRNDFRGIFEAMDGHPVTVRLLDPPLHEFLPNDEAGQQGIAGDLGISREEVTQRVKALEELNPMLGHRGCRLGVTTPTITRMQARALLEAAVECTADGVAVHPEIMVPLVGNVAELRNQKQVIEEVAETVFAEKGQSVDYEIGTMIEVPRAALNAGQIAEEAAFFSFGTNDLTQMTFGFSRDDAGSFLPYYLDHDLLPDDPFQVLDRDGVGQLVETGTERGRAARSGLKVGICGEHGGEPKSVAFCYETGLNYVSCSPFRVPIARLAAAQAALKHEE